jgi:hypothetical protein
MAPGFFFLGGYGELFFYFSSLFNLSLCRNPTLKECEDDTHIPEMGTWESSRTTEIQNSIVGVKTPRFDVLFIPLERS